MFSADGSFTLFALLKKPKSSLLVCYFILVIFIFSCSISFLPTKTLFQVSSPAHVLVVHKHPTEMGPLFSMLTLQVPERIQNHLTRFCPQTVQMQPPRTTGWSMTGPCLSC